MAAAATSWFAAQSNYITAPSQIPGLALWLDAADAGTLFQDSNGTIPVTANGQPIGQWRDKSGFGRNAFSNAASLGITYNMNTISYSGSTYVGLSLPSFILSSSSTISVFIIANVISRAGSGNADLINAYPNFNMMRQYLGSTGRYSIFVNNVAASIITTYATLGRTDMYQLVYSPNTGSSFVNGNSFGTFTQSPGTALNTTQPFNLFGGINGTMNEVIIYNTALTTDQRQQVEGYLAWKWGLQGNLPGTHPYRGSSNNPGFSVALPLLSQSAFVPQNNYITAPTQLSGLALWLDAADSNTVTVSPGTSFVTAWLDKSGNGRDATAFLNPTYTINNAINFNGTQWLSNSVSSSLTNETAFIVLRNNNITGTNTTIGSSSSGGRQFRFATTLNNITTSMQTIKQSITNILVTTIPVANNIPFIAEFTNNGTTLVHYYNGIIAGSTNTIAYTSNLTLLIGRQASTGEFMSGAMSEIIIYQNTILTTTQRQQVEGYLAWKWGLQGNLPATHPYSGSPNNPGYAVSFTAVPQSRFVPMWQPNAFSGLALWLDAADATTLFQDSGGTIPVTATGQPVGQWRDKSASNNNFTTVQGTPLYSIAANRIGVDFSSSRGDIMRSSSTFNVISGVTNIFAVGNLTLNGLRMMINFGINTDLSMRFGNGSINSGDIQFGVNGFTQYNGTPVSFLPVGPTGYFIANVVAGRTQTYTLQLSSAFNGRFFNGPMNEIIFYNTALTTTQRQQVEGYLAWKWGLQDSLPFNHPNRFMPPS